jgi:transposase-like protein
MNPQTPCCHHPACGARGPRGPGTLVVHRHVEQRYRCPPCGHTVAATTGTPCYRVHTAADVVPVGLTWRCHGAPLHAMVAAFGLDDRPVAAWVPRAGRHGQQVPQPVVQQGQVALPQVPAAERWVKLGGRRGWRAMALAVPSRVWLGGWVGPPRDRGLITTLVQRVRAWARRLALLVGVDGLASDVTGCRGRPRLGLEPGGRLGQGVQRYARRRVVRVEPRGVRGPVAAIAAGLEATGSGTGIKTASIARLTATLRRALPPLVRRGRARAQTEATLSAGMWRVGGAETCCW